ncbi:MAG: hypothetical protein IIY94_01395 [Oscillospiraceae bacterium]|nr:hypothetical protein [Oscillospiraceae bacterium]
MRIEALYPEFCQWFGDSENVRYLRQCLPEAELVETASDQTPAFLDGSVDLLILGSMTERQQLAAVQRLTPYKDRLLECIDAGMAVLATGNATELFGEYIEENGVRYPMLSLFPFHAQRDQEHRHNSMFLGEYEDTKIVGYRAQFSFLQGDFPGKFIHVLGGCGNSMGDPNEGFRYKNLFATYLLGPFLILNPPFTKYLLRLLGQKDTLAFEKAVTEAYAYRRDHLEMKEAKFFFNESGWLE